MTSNPAPSPWFRWNAVCIDCAPGDFDRVVSFYCDMLGLQVADGGGRWKMLLDPGGGMGINVQAEDWFVPPVWPESVPDQTKMMHFEVQVDDVQAAVKRAIALGGREAPQQPPDRDSGSLRIMLDPAGHPFCLWS